MITKSVSPKSTGDTNMLKLNEILEAIYYVLAIILSLRELGWLQAASVWYSEILHGSFALASAAMGGGLTLLPHMCTC